jgi:hypothetical protein
MKYFLVLLISLLALSFVSAAYTAPTYTNVTIRLGTQPTYVAPLYTNVTIVLDPAFGGGPCSPSMNVNWIITTQEICLNKEVSIGSGTIIIKPNGNLTLSNANVTYHRLQLETTGQQVFIIGGSRFIQL